MGSMGSVLPMSAGESASRYKPPTGAEPPELIKWLIRINLIRIEKDQTDRGRRKRKENI